MIVVDTNVLISAALIPGSIPASAVNHVIATDRLAMSEATLSEVEGVLARPRLRARLAATRLDEFLALLRLHAMILVVDETVTDCCDLDDNCFLEVALAANAPVIISGDEDLLVLNPWRGRQILTPRAYLDSFR